MSESRKTRKTVVGEIHPEVLQFTAGEDLHLDLVFAEHDCIGTAAHVTMLSRMPVKPALFSAADRDQVVAALVETIGDVRAGRFRISLEDQDVHLAVENRLTRKLGDLGKKVHTGRSRNDQVAVDLRLYARDELIGTLEDLTGLCRELLKMTRRHVKTPMAGRTHMQPAMPSSVGLWAGSHLESLLDDAQLIETALDLTDQSPLGSAASYGVPLPIDRHLSARLLGFSGPIHNVLYANNSRGKLEYTVLSALSQTMLTLAKLAQDLILYSMPEFGYFSLPAELCTGSSIMPQKRNPDVLELIRAKASRLLGQAFMVADLNRGLPGGYNRDLQEAKGPFLDGLATARSSLRVMTLMIDGLGVDKQRLLAGFSPGVFATDRALELVAGGMPFRDAYAHVKAHLDELSDADPAAAVQAKTHYGATGGMDLACVGERIQRLTRATRGRKRRIHTALSRLLGVSYPDLASS